MLGCGPVSQSQPVAQQASDGGVDAAPFLESAHPPPLAIPSNGGAVLASATIDVVTYEGYALADDVESMAAAIPASQWLAAVGAEYGVGAPTIAADVRLTESAPAFASSSEFSAY